MTNSTAKQSWADSEGRAWLTTIQAIDAVRLRDSAGIDLLNPKSIEKLFGADPLVRIEALGELARPQWERKQLGYTDFANALLSTDTSFIEATAALRLSISDFFRKLGRGDLATVSDRAWAVMEADQQSREAKAGGAKVGEILALAQAKAEADVDRALDETLEKLSQTPGKASGSSLASAAPTGDH